jgi:Ni/Co efflux regulator RcnB
MHLLTLSRKCLVLMLAALLIAALPASAAPPEGKGKGNPHKVQKQNKEARKDHGPGVKHDRYREGDTAEALISAVIGFDAARRLALDNRYTGYSALPPGIRKNLARGKPIPPGIARRSVPGPMLAKLPRYPGYEWAVYGSDLVLVATATAVIADVLFDVFD